MRLGVVDRTVGILDVPDVEAEAPQPHDVVHCLPGNAAVRHLGEDPPDYDQAPIGRGAAKAQVQAVPAHAVTHFRAISRRC